MLLFHDRKIKSSIEINERERKGILVNYSVKLLLFSCHCNFQITVSVDQIMVFIFIEFMKVLDHLMHQLLKSILLYLTFFAYACVFFYFVAGGLVY